MVVVAVKSAGKRWKINAPKFKQCMIDGYKCPIYGVPYYIDGCILHRLLYPLMANDGATNYDLKFTMKPYNNDVVKPFVGKLLPLS